MTDLTRLAWPCPAKLNLFLHIVGRRDDGYHLLQTLFQLLDYGDFLYFKPNESGEVRLLTELEGVAPERNLILRAAQLLKARAGRPALGADITLAKRLPLGAGLGGGSSNAATTLLVLNQMWNLNFSLGQLAHWGLSLGADVPVFVRGATAWAEGIGEVLTPLPESPSVWYLVLTPDCSVSTGEVFSHPLLTRDTPIMKMRTSSLGYGQNDCEPIVRKLYPQVDKALNWLAQYAPSRLTGTGSSIFAAFSDEFEARQIAALVPENWQVFVAKAVKESPVLEMLNQFWAVAKR